MKTLKIALLSSLLFCNTLNLKSQIINTIAGDGNQGYFGDGSSALNAQMYWPMGVSVNYFGDVYFCDYGNNVIRKIEKATGLITTVAGNGTNAYTGDGGVATAASLAGPRGILVDSVGNIFISEGGNSSNSEIRKVNISTGIITTIAGTGVSGFSGDGGLAINAQISSPESICMDKLGNIYFVDRLNHRVRKINKATGIITTIAGDGNNGFSGDGALAVNAKLSFPMGVAVDSIGNVYIGDASNYRVRKITKATGIITTIAGNGTAAYTGDGGAATSASFNYPSSLFIDAVGDIYICDRWSYVVRKITVATGIVTTVIGGGSVFGDGGLATNAQLNAPHSICQGQFGSIIVSDYYNNRIREVSGPATSISEIASNNLNLSIYPNPSSDVLIVNGINQKSSIKIFDISGKLVKEQLVLSNTVINIKDISEGFYSLLIENEKGKQCEKIIINKNIN